MKSSMNKGFDVLILQHHTDAPAGSLLGYLETRGLSYKVLVLSALKQPLPTLTEFENLVIQGGGMNVDEEALYPWLKEEKKFIRHCIDAGKRVLGICLGGQLIAEVLGGKVQKHEHWELGWHSVKMQGVFEKIFKKTPKLMVFQWHGYRFQTPKNAERVATNTICSDQAFLYKNKVIGLQFHPESTVRWIQECAATSIDDYPQGEFVQDPNSLLSEVAKKQRSLQNWYFELLDYWLST
jgi:GMP synthase-like glutamine amidotransferase